MDALLQDLRYAVRSLRRSLGYSAVAVLTLALGIGANTAIFSAVEAILLRPLPYPASDRLVDITSTGFDGSKVGISYPDVEAIRTLTGDFVGVAAYSTQRYNLTGAGDPREIQAASVSADLFTVLGAHTAVGRTFTASEEHTPLAVLSYGLWKRSFGGDRSVLGKAISLDGMSYTVVGVVSADFRFPDDNVEVWTPLGGMLSQDPRSQTSRFFHILNSVARLTPTTSLDQARSDLAVLSDRLAASTDTMAGPTIFGGPRPDRPTGSAGPQAVFGAAPTGGPPRAGGPQAAFRGMPTGGPAGAGGPQAVFRGTRPGSPQNAGGPRIGPSPLRGGFGVGLLRDRVAGNVRAPLLVLLGAVALVLLIACANAANLLLARAVVRRREIAIRQALGATRMRLIRQLLTESVLLALCGAAIGTVLAGWGLTTVLKVWPEVLPRATEIGLSGSVLGFTTALAMLTGLIFGLVPALRVSAAGIEEGLRDGGAGGVGARRRLQGGLVTAEVALALVLLVGAGLLLESFIRLSNVDLGFDAHNVLAVRIRLTPSRYPTGAQQTEFFRQIVTTLRSNAAVASAGLTTTLPLSGGKNMIGFDPHTIRPDITEAFMIATVTSVGPDFFAIMRVPILRGRPFTELDRAGAPRVAIVNEALAKALWPGQDPIDRELPLGGGPAMPTATATVIGVTPDLHTGSLEETTPQPGLYFPALQEAEMPEMWLVLRSRTGSTLALMSAVRGAVEQADRTQPIGEIVSFETLIGRRTAPQRFNTTLLGIFALIALSMALVGIYGLTSYGVTQRTRELGIRIALGARAGDVQRLLLAESFRRVALGIVLGIGVALAATRALATLLWGVGAADPATYAITALLVAAAALAATYIPARRATRVDPMVALRTE